MSKNIGEAITKLRRKDSRYKDYTAPQIYKVDLQKADKGIEKIEKEEKQLSRLMKFWQAAKTQRVLKGRWR